jgi:hypothetical protein
VAYPNSLGARTGYSEVPKENGEIPLWDKGSKPINTGDNPGILAHTNGAQLKGVCKPFGILAKYADIGGPSRWEAEPNVGRVADGVPDRAHRLKALGNAVVPQIPELIGRAIMEFENAS